MTKYHFPEILRREQFTMTYRPEAVLPFEVVLFVRRIGFLEQIVAVGKTFHQAAKGALLKLEEMQ